MGANPGRFRRIVHAVLAVAAAGLAVIAGFFAYAALTLPVSPATAADPPPS